MISTKNKIADNNIKINHERSAANAATGKLKLYDELKARGLIAQVTNEEEISTMVNEGKATFYIGFDCTADSLTAGHFMALTLMKRLQLAGNRPIALIGGGTTMIGDPSGLSLIHI